MNSMSAFQLPAGCTDALQQLYRQNDTAEAFVSSLKKEPLLLAELFELAWGNDQWVQTNASSFKDIAAHILSNGCCKCKELQKISSIFGESLLPYQQKCIEKAYLFIHGHPLTLEEAFDLLLSQKPDAPLAKHALAFISEQTGQEISYSEEGILRVTVGFSEEHTEKLLNMIAQLDSEKRKKIELCLQPKTIVMKSSKLKGFLKRYGNELDAFSLRSWHPIDDHCFQKLIAHCTRLTRLSICSFYANKPNTITTLEMVPNLQNLKTLDCSESLLQTLPALPSLTTLDCRGSPLQSLPELPSLTTLNCRGCSFQSLPKFPSLLKLDCGYCNKLQKLPEFPALMELSCDDCALLQSLPELPTLRELTCLRCPSLRELPELPSLTVLNCWRCPFKGLPQFPTLMELYCSECAFLESLPKFPSLMYLDCSGCASLRMLPELPALKSLNCSGCNRLESLSEFPVLMEINCDRCSSLRALPELPSLKRLFCSDCISLGELPKNYLAIWGKSIELTKICLQFLFSIYKTDPERALKITSPLKVKEEHFTFYSNFAASRNISSREEELSVIEAFINELYCGRCSSS